MLVSFSLSLELAGIEHKVQGWYVRITNIQIRGTSEQFDQSLSFPSHFLPIDRP